MPVTRYVLGVDIGTSSSKGVLVRTDGVVVASCKRAHQTSFPRPGWAEHDPETIWWADFVAICRQLATRDRPVDCVAVSGIGPCLLPVGENFQPLRPAILYGIDTRATREIEELNKRYGVEPILERGGSLLSTQAVGPKLLWLRRNEPDIWARTQHILMASSYLVHRLTDQYVLDHHSASQCNPMYDLRKEIWSVDWAHEICGHIQLPQLVWPTDVVGSVTREAARATGLKQGMPVLGGTIDAWAEAHSVGVSDPGDTMLMYGSTMFVIQVAHEPRPLASMWLTAGVTPHSRTYAAGMATSGAVAEWLRAAFGRASHVRLTREASTVQPGSEGLVLLPYFAGERSPLFDPMARGMIIGLTLRHRRGHLYRAALEGTAYALRHNLEVMASAGATPARLVAVGGGTTGNLWTQIVSDVTGYEQEVPYQTIGASYGDAALAAAAAGALIDPRRWARIKQRIRPDPRSREAYDRLYPIFRSLYQINAATMHHLAEIQERSGAATPAAG